MLKRTLSDHLCECGCGSYTYIAQRSYSGKGHVKGKPLRFLPGHYANLYAQRSDEAVDNELRERLLRKRKITDAECWEWTGCLSLGYGATTRRSVPVKVHRVAYELWVGPIPDGLCVCHHCDNRACFNPEHLFVGTIADNNRDMTQKGRRRTRPMPGEENPRSILTTDQVLEIKRRYKTDDVTQEQLADEYGVHQTTISHAIIGLSWRHLKED